MRYGEIFSHHSGVFHKHLLHPCCHEVNSVLYNKTTSQPLSRHLSLARHYVASTLKQAFELLRLFQMSVFSRQQDGLFYLSPPAYGSNTRRIGCCIQTNGSKMHLFLFKRLRYTSNPEFFFFFFMCSGERMRQESKSGWKTDADVESCCPDPPRYILKTSDAPLQLAMGQMENTTQI